MLPLEKRKYTLEMWVEENSAWEESNWKRYITQWERGAHWWCGQQDTPKSPILLKVASSNHKEQIRVGKVTSKFLTLLLPSLTTSRSSARWYGYHGHGALNWLYLLLQLSSCLWILRERSPEGWLLSVKFTFKSWLYLQKSSHFGYYCAHSCLVCIVVAAIISQW